MLRMRRVGLERFVEAPPPPGTTVFATRLAARLAPAPDAVTAVRAVPVVPRVGLHPSKDARFRVAGQFCCSCGCQWWAAVLVGAVARVCVVGHLAWTGPVQMGIS